MSRHDVWITTDAKLVVCRCGAVALRGWAEGISIMVEPWPADRVTEAIALLDGRWTFTMIQRQLYRREGSTFPGPVMVQHACGHVLTRTPPVPPPKDDPDIPPF
jgi:hypothetical protein